MLYQRHFLNSINLIETSEKLNVFKYQSNEKVLKELPKISTCRKVVDRIPNQHWGISPRIFRVWKREIKRDTV
jgi:hypothetical protein